MKSEGLFYGICWFENVREILFGNGWYGKVREIREWTGSPGIPVPYLTLREIFRTVATLNVTLQNYRYVELFDWVENAKSQL
jgi:hypothetical protein